MVLSVAAAMLGLTAAALSLAPAASAAPYPPTECAAVSVNTTTPIAGQSITVSGTGFTGSSVSITLSNSSGLNSTLASSVAVAADGTFSTQVMIPSGISGTYQLTVVGGAPTCPVGPISLDVRGSGIGGVTAGPAPNGSGTGGLSLTGTNAALLLGAALLLIAVGVLFTRGGRRRAHNGW